MKFRQHLLFALTGWLAGALTTLGCGLLGPMVFPGIMRVSQSYGTAPSLPLILGNVLLLVSPTALLGGLIGGRLPKEGGPRDQILTALIFGSLMALPCACVGLWLFSG